MLSARQGEQQLPASVFPDTLGIPMWPAGLSAQAILNAHQTRHVNSRSVLIHVLGPIVVPMPTVRWLITLPTVSVCLAMLGILSLHAACHPDPLSLWLLMIHVNLIPVDQIAIHLESLESGASALACQTWLAHRPTVGQSAQSTRTVPRTRPALTGNVRTLVQAYVESMPTAVCETMCLSVFATRALLAIHSPAATDQQVSFVVLPSIPVVPHWIFLEMEIGQTWNHSLNLGSLIKGTV